MQTDLAVGLEPAAVKTDLGKPPWLVTRKEGMFGGKWAEFWLLVRNTSVDSELVSLWHSAVVGIGGGFYLNNQQVSAEQMGTFIAELCDGDKSRAQALFQSALAGEALSARW